MQETLSLCLERNIPHPLPAVYRAWTQSSMLKAWFGLVPGDRLLDAWLDAKPGGPFHFRLHRQDGITVDYRGLFDEVEPERRLCLNWPAYGMSEFQTRLELDFAPDGRETLLVLLHDGLRDRKMQDHYRTGWTLCLDGLIRELPGILQRN